MMQMPDIHAHPSNWSGRVVIAKPGMAVSRSKPTGRKIREPRTPKQWQAAVDAAAFSLLLAEAGKFGLLIGPEIDVKRCRTVIAQGKAQGIKPAAKYDLTQRFISELVGRFVGPDRRTVEW